MNRNTILIILVIVIILFGVGFVVFNPFNTQETINVGGCNFLAPQGYHEGILNEAGDVNLTDGKNSVFIAKYDGNDTYGYMKNYITSREKVNESITTSNFTYNGILVYKAVNDNSSSTHYWFNYNHNVYSVYTWSNNPNIDTIFIDLIKSINKEK